MEPLRFQGANRLRQRLALATLSGRKVQITRIRTRQGQQVGLTDAEACVLRLLDLVTDGGKLEINETGTTLTYVPGVLVGGVVAHACPTSRGLSYFLEPLLLLAPFMKNPLEVTLTGVTNHAEDVSVDTFRAVTLGLLKPFGVDGLALKVLKRGAPPLGGGKVVFSCPIVPRVNHVEWVKIARVQRIRGVALSTKVSSQFCARMVDNARRCLNMCCPDVWIYAEHCKGEQAGKSPGFALSLFAETTSTTSVLSADSAALDGAVEEPEELGARVAARLLEEIALGGVCDTTHQYLPLWFMSLADDLAPSKVRLSRLTPQTTALLRDIQTFLGPRFKFESCRDPEGEGTIVCSCVGIGHRNLARRTF